MVDVIGMLKAAFTFGAELVGFKSKKLDLNNQADVKQAAKAQDAVTSKSQIEKAVADEDTEAVRRSLS